MWRMIVIATLVAMAQLAAGPVAAQAGCGAHADLVAKLEGLYRETKAGMGLTVTGRLLELYTAEQRGTWTLLLVTPQGTACMVSAGQDWVWFGSGLRSTAAQAVQR